MSAISSQAKRSQYELTIIDFVTNEHGCFIVFSDDQPFQTLLRQTLQKHLSLPNVVSPVTTPDELTFSLKSHQLRAAHVVLFIERAVAGQGKGSLLEKSKDIFPGLKVIVLTNDVQRDQVMILHETGADNFVTKPVSINTLVEKIAFTLKPQSRLGQMIDEAKLCLANEDAAGALELSESILQLKPNSAAGFLIRGDAYRQLGATDKALEAYECARDNAEMYLDPLSRLSDLYGDLGNLPEKLHYLEDMDRISPLNADRKVSIGGVQLDLGNRDKASNMFNAAMELVTKVSLTRISEIANTIADVCMNKDPVMAEVYLRRSLDTKGDYISRDDLHTFNQLGINLRQQGKWQEAIVEYKRAIALFPDDENLYYNIGMAYAEGRNFAMAVEQMQKAMRLNPDLPKLDPNIAYNMGVVFTYAGNKKQAEECLLTALELNPDFEAARRTLNRLRQGWTPSLS
jgi:tetratricopeptide (TPR) repeat protein/CheY-like chemotaxis protein